MFLTGSHYALPALIHRIETSCLLVNLRPTG
jgi:hypothetical protein